MTKLTQANLKKLRDDKKAEQKKKSDFKKETVILIGMGTCGIAAGAKEAFDAFEKQISESKLDNVVIKQTGCMGLCYSEPTVEVIVPGMAPVIYGRVDVQTARTIVADHLVNKKPVEANVMPRPSTDMFEIDTVDPAQKQFRIVLRNCGVIDPENISEYIARDGYAALEKALFKMKPKDVIEELKKSGLRGRGGAGFPTWKKWAFSMDCTDPTKYVVCNADEGDPGAYMDRSTLEGDPHSVLESMAIAGYTVGASHGVIYIRAEYPLAIQRLEIALKQARELGLLGNDILGSGFNFDIEIRLGAGAFVCGEETALLASIEGKRGMPIPRPPFPAVKGLWGHPTVINNVETWANIPVILLKGGDWFGKIGTSTSKGTKVFALTGKVRNCGLIEVPMGTTLRDIVYDVGGGIHNDRAFKAVQTGGPSGGMIKAEFLDTPIDYETLSKLGSIMGSGGMIVMDEDDCMVDVSKFYLEFSVDESCGKCAPCRIGGRQMHTILDRITKGKGTMEDPAKIRKISQAMCRASLCGLGQNAANPVISSLTYFEEEYLAHIQNSKCPAKKCTHLMSYQILAEKCIGCGLCAKKCPVNAITGEKRQAHIINSSTCIKCGECFQVCKFGAVIKN